MRGQRVGQRQENHNYFALNFFFHVRSLGHLHSSSEDDQPLTNAPEATNRCEQPAHHFASCSDRRGNTMRSRPGPPELHIEVQGPMDLKADRKPGSKNRKNSIDPTILWKGSISTLLILSMSRPRLNIYAALLYLDGFTAEPCGNLSSRQTEA